MKEDSQSLYINLTFSGNCREAMTFYKHCLGGELFLQTVGESPQADKLPEDIKNLILHASLRKQRMLITASDMVADDKLIKGNSIAIMLNCTDEQEIRAYYKRLSAGGRQTEPLQRNHWGILMGNVTDKYGYQWLLCHDYLRSRSK